MYTPKTYSHGTMRFSCSLRTAIITIIEVTNTARESSREKTANITNALRTENENILLDFLIFLFGMG